MKKIFLCAAIVIVATAGCGKKYTCGHSITYRQPGVAFTGFTTAEINQIVVRSYTAGSAFSNMISADTIAVPNPVFNGDTAYAIQSEYGSPGFFMLEPGVDYKVVSPATQQEFSITEIAEGDKYESWTQTSDCSAGSTMSKVTTYSLKINGVDVVAMPRNFNNFMLYLQR